MENPPRAQGEKAGLILATILLGNALDLIPAIPKALEIAVEHFKEFWRSFDLLNGLI